MRIAVDGMGGDNAPQEIIKGCVEASKVTDHEIYIVGPEDVLKKELRKYKFDRSRIKIVHAPEVITNDDPPVKAARTEKGLFDDPVDRSAAGKEMRFCDFRGKYRSTDGRFSF